jgi:hypothetical protein
MSVDEATRAERTRILVIHKICQNRACPALFRGMVKRGLTIEEAEEQAAAVMAGRDDR